MAAKERRLRQGDIIIALDKQPLNGMRLSEALKQKRAEAEAAEAQAAEAAAAEGPAAAPASAPAAASARRGEITIFWLVVMRTYEQLPEQSDQAAAVTDVTDVTDVTTVTDVTDVADVTAP